VEKREEEEDARLGWGKQEKESQKGGEKKKKRGSPLGSGGK